MCKAVGIRRVVGKADDVAAGQLGLVLQDGGLALAQLLEDEVALLAAAQLDAVDGRARPDGRVVGRIEGPVEEGVEDGALAAAAGAQHVAQHHVALDARLAPLPAPRLGDLERHGRAALLVALEAQVGQVLERGLGVLEGGHAPLRQPALQRDVPGLAPHRRAREAELAPRGRQAGRGRKQGRQLALVQAAVVVFVEQEEQIDEEAVADRRQLRTGVRRHLELGVQERVLEAERVGVVEGAQDRPDGLVAALLGKDLVEQDKTPAVDAGLGARAGRRLADERLDFVQIVLRKLLVEALHLEVLDLLVVQEAVLVSVAQNLFSSALSLSPPHSKTYKRSAAGRPRQQV